MTNRSHLSTAVLIAIACIGSLPPSLAHAENRAVANRLKAYGELSERESRALIKAVSKRMSRAATRHATNDPVRLSVKQALAADTRSTRRDDARVRRRLRAGLDIWALEHLFAPRPAALDRCSHEYQLSSNQCESLLAASGGISLAGVHAISAAPAPGGMPARELRSAKAIVRVPAQRRDPHAPSPAVVARKKREYQRQRAAYLERRRQELEARKARIMATAGTRVQRGPASAMEAELIGLPPTAAAKQAARPGSTRTDLGGTDGEMADTLVRDPLGKGGARR